MGSTEEHLQRWLGEGLIDAPTADRIRLHEAAAQRETVGERPGVMEALIYLGLAVVGAGVIVLLTSNWDDLESWARILVVGVPAALAVVVGQGMRTAEQAELRRGGWVAWLAAVALTGGTAAVAANETGWEGDNQALAAGIVATVLALAMWAFEPQHPQVVGMAGALSLLGGAVGAKAGDYELFIGAGLIAVTGLAALLLTEAGLLTPRLSARVLGAAGLGVGAFYMGIDADVGRWAVVFVFVAGGILVVASILAGTFIYMLFGVAALFFGLLRVMIEYVEDPTLRALGLMVVGTALIAGVLLAARFKPWQRAKAPS
jgi:uncharacterized membrane protein